MVACLSRAVQIFCRWGVFYVTFSFEVCLDGRYTTSDSSLTSFTKWRISAYFCLYLPALDTRPMSDVERVGKLAGEAFNNEGLSNDLGRFRDGWRLSLRGSGNKTESCRHQESSSTVDEGRGRVPSLSSLGRRLLSQILLRYYSEGP